MNGKAHSLEPPIDVSALSASPESPAQGVAERNGEIVPRSAHANTLLADGDALEVVVAVGGG